MRGFTLIEVVMALLILELGLLGVVGVLTQATQTMRNAETLERAVAEAQGLLDSIAADPVAGEGRRSFRGGEISWSIRQDGWVELAGTDLDADTLLTVVTVTRWP